MRTLTYTWTASPGATTARRGGARARQAGSTAWRFKCVCRESCRGVQPAYGRSIANDSYILARARLHDLRHTVASHAVISGENLPLVGKLLEHRRHATTAGYAHLADEHLAAAAALVPAAVRTGLRRPQALATLRLHRQACFLYYGLEAARRVRNRSIARAVDAAAQAPLRLTVRDPAVYSARCGWAWWACAYALRALWASHLPHLGCLSRQP